MKPAKKNGRDRAIFLLMGALLLSAPYSFAAEPDAKNKQERAAQRRMQQMQQKFEQDVAALEQEKAALKEQTEIKLAAARKELARQRRELDKLQAEHTEKGAQLASCQREAESARLAASNDLAATRQKQVETAQQLQQSEALNKRLNSEKSGLELALAEQKTEVGACQAKNANLLDLFNEMASQHEKAELKYVEPWTGLKGVEIENRFQNARDHAEAQLYRSRQ
ncbi:MAG: hypothetical protein FD134_1057 [Gallionellaceae bacterium]|nr:MAG: hypothetical protein FD134_1057 [Gallionellaceae bacterium]